jgi:hypothetical protein
MQQDVFSQFRNSLNLPRHFKIKLADYTESNESVFDSALNYLPIPASYSRTFTEVKGINIHVLSRLEEAIGSSGQHMLLIGRALKWYAFIKYGPLDWNTVRPYYVDYYVRKCQVELIIVNKFMDFDLEKKTKVEDHLKRLWTDFRNSALIFWERSLRYPSHELTFGALQDIYIRNINADSFLPWPTPSPIDTVIFSMSTR